VTTTMILTILTKVAMMMAILLLPDGDRRAPNPSALLKARALKIPLHLADKTRNLPRDDALSDALSETV